MEWLRKIMLPAQGSVYAGEVDTVYMALFWLSVVLFLGIAIPSIYFPWRYRYKAGRVTPHQTHNTALEILWSVAPLLLCVGIFFWGLKGWMEYAVAPGEAMEVQITAKKWLWAFEYPDGSRDAGRLHVPINKPVKFIMTSEDVIHDFFVPDMRVKHDIIPGRYTEVWFTPTVMGEHMVTCAEYCGKGHSDMRATLIVESEADFQNYLATGGTEWEDYKNNMAAWGKIQWERKGCNSCHSLDGSTSKGPSWKGIWNKMEKMSDGSVVQVDEAYIRESENMPQAKIVATFQPIMPTFQGLIKPHEFEGIVALIKSLQ
jgi:cytochrome c oxidase subunit 2